MSRLGKAATCCSVFICIVAIAVGALLAAGNARRAARLSKYASKPGVIPELPLSAHIIHTVGDVLEATGLYRYAPDALLVVLVVGVSSQATHHLSTLSSLAPMVANWPVSTCPTKAFTQQPQLPPVA